MAILILFKEQNKKKPASTGDRQRVIYGADRQLGAGLDNLANLIDSHSECYGDNIDDNHDDDDGAVRRTFIIIINIDRLVLRTTLGKPQNTT